MSCYYFSLTKTLILEILLEIRDYESQTWLLHPDSRSGATEVAI